MKWKPIETVPKDETWVLLFAKSTGVPEEPRSEVAFWAEDEDGGGWYDSEAASSPIFLKPTHWCEFEPPVGYEEII